MNDLCGGKVNECIVVRGTSFRRLVDLPRPPDIISCSGKQHFASLLVCTSYYLVGSNGTSWPLLCCIAGRILYSIPAHLLARKQQHNPYTWILGLYPTLAAFLFLFISFFSLNNLVFFFFFFFWFFVSFFSGLTWYHLGLVFYH